MFQGNAYTYLVKWNTIIPGSQKAISEIEWAQVTKKQAICENESSKQFQLTGNQHYINKPTPSKKKWK